MKKTKIYCRFCEHYTNHELKAEYKPLPVEDEDTGVTNTNEYSIMECLGCDAVSFQRIYWDSTDINENGEIIKYEDQYPEDLDQYNYYNFLNEDDLNELPRMIEILYVELKKSLKDELNTLGGGDFGQMVPHFSVKQCHFERYCNYTKYLTFIF